MVQALNFKLGGQGIKSLGAAPVGLLYPTYLLAIKVVGFGITGYFRTWQTCRKTWGVFGYKKENNNQIYEAQTDLMLWCFCCNEINIWSWKLHPFDGSVTIPMKS